PFIHTVSEFGSNVAGGAGVAGPTQFMISIPCPTSINGVQGKLLTAFLKFKRVAGIVTIDNVRLMDSDIVVGAWPPPIVPLPPVGADYVATFQLNPNVSIVSGLALYFRVVELPGDMEILG